MALYIANINISYSSEQFNGREGLGGKLSHAENV